MLHLRLARQDAREEAPLHFEAVTLRPRLQLGAWLGGIAAALLGITMMVRLAGRPAALAGALLASAGAVAVGAVVRCRRFETIVGRRWLRWRCGPFSGDVPRGIIHGGTVGVAHAWRSLYSAHEVRVGLTSDQSGPALPSLEPESLVNELDGAVDG
jgi:hypothetical protein